MSDCNCVCSIGSPHTLYGYVIPAHWVTLHNRILIRELYMLPILCNGIVSDQIRYLEDIMKSIHGYCGYWPVKDNMF